MDENKRFIPENVLEFNKSFKLGPNSKNEVIQESSKKIEVHEENEEKISCEEIEKILTDCGV